MQSKKPGGIQRRLSVCVARRKKFTTVSPEIFLPRNAVQSFLAHPYHTFGSLLTGSNLEEREAQGVSPPSSPGCFKLSNSFRPLFFSPYLNWSLLGWHSEPPAMPREGRQTTNLEKRKGNNLGWVGGRKEGVGGWGATKFAWDLQCILCGREGRKERGKERREGRHSGSTRQLSNSWTFFLQDSLVSTFFQNSSFSLSKELLHLPTLWLQEPGGLLCQSLARHNTSKVWRIQGSFV